MKLQALPWTGERYLPEVHGSVELEHLHRYLFASQLSISKRVLDIASGEGYGSAMLARSAEHVTGVDISADAILHAREKYKTDNLEYQQGSCTAIPLSDCSVDLVVSFETIEHHDQHGAMMLEIKRVLKPGGVLVISSPDRREYSDKPGYRNEYHVKELYRDEFESLLGCYFNNHVIFGQRAVYGSLILQEDGDYRSETYRLADKDSAASPGLSNAIYLIAIATDGAIPPVKVGLLDQEVSSINEIAERDVWIESLIKTIDSLIIDRDSQAAGVQQLRDSLETLARQRDEQVVKLKASVVERDEIIRSLNQSVDSLVMDRDSQIAGVQQLRDSLETLARQRDEQVMQMRASVVERDEIIRSLNQSVDSLVMDRDAQIAGVQQLRDSLETLARQRDEQIAKFYEVINKSESQIEKLKSELSVIYKSKTWRSMTRLRQLARKFVGINNGEFEVNGAYPNVITGHGHRTTSITGKDIGTTSKQINTKFCILLVSHYCPTRAHAGGLRILDIYALIRRQCPNVQIDLLTFHRPSIDWSLDDAHRIFHNVYLSPAEELTPEVLFAIRGAHLRYDVIDLQFHQSGFQIDRFRRFGKKIIFTPMEALTRVAFMNLRTNLLTVNRLRLQKMAASMKLAAEEVIFSSKADEVVCVSRTDAAILRAVTFSRHVHGVDTGVSQIEFTEAPTSNFPFISAENRKCNVVFVAYFGSETNVSALRWYLDRVHPIIKASVPGYVFSVVGRGDLTKFSHYRDNSIKFVGEVTTISPSIQEARVGIAPALDGSGLRGKINQYAILGVPSVVSPVAHKGLEYRDGENIFVAGKPELFADRCITLLTDLALNDRMGQAARDLCLATYSWQSKWPAIRKIYTLENEEVRT